MGEDEEMAEKEQNELLKPNDVYVDEEDDEDIVYLTRNNDSKFAWKRISAADRMLQRRHSLDPLSNPPKMSSTPVSSLFS